ncbi:hypothetical protein [Dysgonomonas termitidis]|uniref:DUF4258 domain-containing protein n=1 Tax=Dysgonomonas termitidis TaxID=1516126 RepID=A0ABV9KTT8_9BACT
MERMTVNGHYVSQYRKNITKFAQGLKDKAVSMLEEGKSLKEIYDALNPDIRAKANGIYASYRAACEWAKYDALYIRNANGDYTIITIIPVSHES